jgi:cytochrome c biogenesis protein CcmG, thiol:disulfide interchange protein DsbE
MRAYSCMPGRIIGLLLVTALSLAAQADEFFSSLEVKGEVYTNVTVTTVTATDIYFTHARGLASAKLKDLNPELQKHFHFNAAESAQVERAQAKATADFREKLALQKAQPRPTTPPAITAATEAGDDFVAPRIKARSVRGESAPQLIIEKWITDEPDTRGKFVIIDFWATWCGPCRESIPELNSFQKKFGDRLAIIGISNESEDAVRKMTTPQIDYCIAIDTQARMARSLELKAVPHSLLISPDGIVRYEGNPLYLDEKRLKNLLDKYSR